MIKMKYVLHNVDQCWNCKNCVGVSYPIPFSRIRKYIAPILECGRYDDGVVICPECKVTEEYMLYVNQRICPRYEVNKNEGKYVK